MTGRTVCLQPKIAATSLRSGGDHEVWRHALSRPPAPLTEVECWRLSNSGRRAQHGQRHPFNRPTATDQCRDRPPEPTVAGSREGRAGSREPRARSWESGVGKPGAGSRVMETGNRERGTRSWE